MKKTIFSGILISCLVLMGSKSQFPGAGGNGQPAYSGGGGCTDGPTGSLIARFDAPAAGTVTTWTSSVGGITATKQGSGTISSVGSVFGAQPGVRLTAASSQYFSLSSVLNGGAGINNLTIMIVWKPATVSGSQFFFTGNSGTPAGAFGYWVADILQGANVNYVVEVGRGSHAFTANVPVQMSATYNFDTSTLFFRKDAAADALTGSATFHNLTQGIDTLFQDGNGTGFVDGWIGAVYIFAPYLSLSDVQSWETYFTCQYGV